MTPARGVRPLTVVSGALGSGKTTLLRRLLRQPGLRDTAVLVNELGEVGLDHLQLRRIDEATVVLPGGCVCCARRDDVETALRELLDGEAAGVLPPFRRVVLETTGVADPAPVVATLLRSPVLRHHVAVDRVVVTVDAQAVTAEPEQGPEWLQQVLCADVLALTKTDLVAESALPPLLHRLAGLDPAAVPVRADEVDLTAPLSSGASALRVPPLRGPQHLAGIASASGHLDGPVDWAAFAVWLSALLHAHGDRVLRFKAVLDTGDGPPLVVDGVQHVVHPPRHLDGPEGRDGVGSSVVVVTRDLDPHEVLEALRRFVRPV